MNSQSQKIYTSLKQMTMLFNLSDSFSCIFEPLITCSKTLNPDYQCQELFVIGWIFPLPIVMPSYSLQWYMCWNENTLFEHQFIVESSNKKSRVISVKSPSVESKVYVYCFFFWPKNGPWILFFRFYFKFCHCFVLIRRNGLVYEK